MDGMLGGIHRNTLVATDEQASAFERLQDNVLNPMINSAMIEPWNLVASVSNSVSDKLTGRELLPTKPDLPTEEAKFLSTPWLVQSVSGGLAMLLPYAVAGKATSGMLKSASAKIGASGEFARILNNEVSSQILGAAIYDGLRETKHGETHLGNALGGATAFGTFAIGSELSRNLPGGQKFFVRTLAGAIGGTAQQTVHSFVANSKAPSLEQLAKASVNGMVMSVVLPEAQNALHSVAKTGNQQLGISAPFEKFYELRIKNKVAKIPVVVEAPPHGLPGEIPNYDFFVKPEHNANMPESKPEKGRDENLKDTTASTTHPGFEFSANSPLLRPAHT